MAAPALGAVPHVNGGVTSMLVDGETLFVGGAFEAVGGAPAGPLAILGSDGELRRTFPRMTGSGERNSVEAPPLAITAIVPDGAGGWYAGGTFSEADGLQRDSLVHFLPDGSVDRAFRADVDGAVTALALRGNTLYVGGQSMRAVSGAPAGSVSAVDARTGARLPFTSDLDLDRVEVLQVDGDALFVGGGGAYVLDAVTGARRPWQPSMRTSGVVDLEVQGDVVYLVGDFWDTERERYGATAVRRTDGQELPVRFAGVRDADAVEWGGTSVIWSGAFAGDRRLIASDPVTGADRGWFTGVSGTGSRAMAADGDRLYVTGPEYLDAFDLRDGTPVAFDTPLAGGFAHTIAAEGGAVAIAGPLGSVGGVTKRHLAAFDARTAEVKPLAVQLSMHPFRPDGTRVLALALVDDVLFVGGVFDFVNGMYQPNLAALDPVTGALLEFPSSPYPVWALASDGANLFAGTDARFDAPGGLLAFDLATGTRRPWDVDSSCRVTDVTVVGDSLYAAGCFDTRFARFALADLTPRPVPRVTGASVNTIIADGAGGVWLGGDFEAVGGAPAAGIARLDAAGNPVPGAPTIDGEATALHVDGDRLTIGGQFNRLQDQTRENAGQVRLTDGAVLPVPFAAGDRTFAFATLPGGALLAGGWFGWWAQTITGGLAHVGTPPAGPVPEPTPSEPTPGPGPEPTPSEPMPDTDAGYLPPSGVAAAPRAVAPHLIARPAVRRPAPRLIAHRGGIRVRLDRPVTRRTGVRVLARGRLLGRATLRPGATSARLVLTRRGRTALRGRPTVTVVMGDSRIRVRLARET